MIKIVVLAIAALPIFYGLPDDSYQSSLMYGEKPILRMGMDSENSDEGYQPRQPKDKWISNLRFTIKHKSEVGSENEGLPGHFPDLRPPPSHEGHGEEWVKELESYIKEMVEIYGKKNITSDVKPVINSIEKAHHVLVTDVDINPYGEVSVNYVRSDQSKPVEERYGLDT